MRADPEFRMTTARPRVSALNCAVVALFCSVLSGRIMLADRPAPAPPPAAGVPAELALARVTVQLEHTPPDPSQSVRLAFLHMQRVLLLAAVAYEQQHPESGQPITAEESDPDEYSVWCRRYLATDPQHAVTDALDAVRRALRQGAPRAKQSELRLIEGTALSYLGRHLEEIAAFRQAKRFAPDQSAVLAHLIRAYSEAGQLSQARAARRVWDQLPQPRRGPLMPPAARATGMAGLPADAGGPSEPLRSFPTW